MTKSLLPKAWNRTFVQKAPLVGFEKKDLKKVGRYFDGCREELTGVIIPLKYLPCQGVLKPRSRNIITH
jgi:hypothetical protein